MALSFYALAFQALNHKTQLISGIKQRMKHADGLEILCLEDLVKRLRHNVNAVWFASQFVYVQIFPILPILFSVCRYSPLEPSIRSISLSISRQFWQKKTYLARIKGENKNRTTLLLRRAFSGQLPWLSDPPHKVDSKWRETEDQQQHLKGRACLLSVTSNQTVYLQGESKSLRQKI